jgi:hypothetical protein
MHNAPRSLGVRRGGADDVHDGNVLGVAARDRVGCRQLPYPESGYQCRHSAQTAVAVCRVTGVEFVGAADPADPRCARM